MWFIISIHGIPYLKSTYLSSITYLHLKILLGMNFSKLIDCFVRNLRTRNSANMLECAKISRRRLFKNVCLNNKKSRIDYLIVNPGLRKVVSEEYA